MKIDLAKYRDKRICVAVSGGRDSMALLHYLYTYAGEYNITLSALNCDHGIRGEASKNDSAFVREWCISRKIPLLFFKWDTLLPKTESNARMWRLKCYITANKPSSLWTDCDSKPSAVFTENGEWQGADAVATAHHMNDNAETVLFNLARGSALSGFTGITDTYIEGWEWNVVHPLVCVPREGIDGYIAENAIPFVEDETNISDDYTRNKIRHSVIPELEKAVPEAVKAIYRFSRLAADDEEYFDNLIKERELIKKTPYGVKISHCEEKVVFKRAVIKALVGWNVKDYTSEHAQKLYELQFKVNGKKFEFLNFTAFKENGKITVCDKTLLHEAEIGRPFSYHLTQNSNIFGGQLVWIADENELDDVLGCIDEPREKLKILKFDPNAIPENAVVRFMKEGDRFTKFGGGTKSLGDYFTDKKIPQRLRKNIPLIAVGADIYAVCGVEISDKIKISNQTQSILYIISKDYIKE